MATPTLALIPTGYKAGKLYSVLPESGVGDFTVVRATEATRVNAEGLIETVGANVPRLDYSGGGCPVLLTEPQSTNLVPYSEDFNSGWIQYGSPTINISSIISPNGTLNGSKITRGSNATPLRYANVTTLNQEYTFSVYAKKGSVDIMILDIGDVAQVEFTLTDEWQRFEITQTPTTFTHIDISFGTSTSGDNFYIWGAQLEQGSYPTSYIKTEGSAVTRNGDQVNGAGDAATFNDSEGVLMAEYSDFDNDSFRQLTLSNGSNSNAISIMNTTTENQVVCFVNNGGVTQASISTILNSTHEFNKIAIKYKANDTVVYINGFERGTDTSGTVPTSLNTLNFDNGAGSGDVYGKTSQIQYFNTALTDSELETLTSWTSFIEMAQAQNYNII